MHWSGWIVVALVVVNAGWMTFDGGRALIAGDYVTPESGEYAGQLGPWATVVEAAGIPPRSTLMKSLFVVYGLAFLLITLAFVMGAPRSWTAMVIVSILGLWYLPFGTLINLLVIILLWQPALRGGIGR